MGRCRARPGYAARSRTSTTGCSSGRCSSARRSCWRRPSTKPSCTGAPARGRSGCGCCRCRSTCAASRRSPVVLVLRRIHYLTGLDLLVDAVEPLLDAGEARLVVVGRDDGHWDELAARYRRLLEAGSLRFDGPLYGDERFRAYAGAAVFCLTPRHWEETSVAALEAAAVGTPVVVTEQADIPGLAESGGGFVVPLDVERIRGAVREALARRDELWPRARVLVERQHAAPAVVERLEGYLRAAVSA